MAGMGEHWPSECEIKDGRGEESLGGERGRNMVTGEGTCLGRLRKKFIGVEREMIGKGKKK